MGGISPDVWGPSTWTFLHLAVMAEPDDFDKSRLMLYKRFYTLLQELLPCQKCRMHLKDNMKSLKNIESLGSKRELFDWTTQLHNLVNKANNKPLYSIDKSFKLWDDIANEKIKLQRGDFWKYTTIALLIAILTYVIYRCMARRTEPTPKKRST